MSDFEKTVLLTLTDLKVSVSRLEVLHEQTAEKIDQLIEVINLKCKRTMNKMPS